MKLEQHNKAVRINDVPVVLLACGHWEQWIDDREVLPCVVCDSGEPPYRAVIRVYGNGRMP